MKMPGEPMARNNIGFLRLVFASMVIVGHAIPMISGSEARDPIFLLFGSGSISKTAVDGFFLLSGYLITKSMISTDAFIPFIERRLLRIYPAFILACLLMFYVMVPLVGGRMLPVLPLIPHILTLGPPTFLPDVFQTLPYFRTINGSMWTIAYEFRCYLFVALLWTTGLLARRGAVLGLTAVGVLGSIAAAFPPVRAHLDALENVHLVKLALGHPFESLRLTVTFLLGTCFCLYSREWLPRLSARSALIASVAALALMFEPHMFQMALAGFGGWALFWLAFKADLGRLRAINDGWDISYGVYLYGWPLANMVRWAWPGISIGMLAAVTLPLSFAMGAASWWGLERWAKDLRRSKSRRSVAAVAPPADPFGQPAPAIEAMPGTLTQS